MDKIYVCQKCSAVAARYMGRCPKCSEFNTMVERLLMDAGIKAQMDYRKNFDWRYELAVVLLKTFNPVAEFHTQDDLYMFIEDQGYRWNGYVWHTDDIVP